MSILAHSSRNKDLLIERWKPAGITPLEIWDLVVDERNLWEWQDHTSFPEILFEALTKLRTGDIKSESKGAIDPAALNFDSIFITGGRSQIPAIQGALGKLNLPTVFGSDPIHGPCVAAVDSFKNSGENLLAIDVGQTQIKIASREKVACFERDLETLPLSNTAVGTSLEAQRSRLTDFISAGIRNFLTENEREPDRVLLALPCYIHPHFALGGSSYLAMKEHPTLLADVITNTGLTKLPWLITNDAELAGLPALTESSFAKSAKTLVLTLGFGTGACILEHRQ